MRRGSIGTQKSLNDLGFPLEEKINHNGAVLFFQLMNRRYERAATVLTWNKGFEEWGEVLGDEVMDAAPIDRICITATSSTSAANSYRIREHTELSRTLRADVEPTPSPRRQRKPSAIATP